MESRESSLINIRPIDVEELQAMCAALVSRGPDDEGTYVKDGAGLAMRRLSIIDLETGHQPVSNEDGSIWVVLNGEIYNYRQLRSDLERRGSPVRDGDGYGSDRAPV